MIKNTDCVITMDNIQKSFSSVNVLKGVGLEVRYGEVHGLMGENGAGKSTLMNILCGVIQPDMGNIYFSGSHIENMNPEKSKSLGIGFVQQELNLSEDLTVAENVFMGRLPMNKFTVNFSKLNKDTNEILKTLGANFDALTLVRSLTTANKQLVEIAKALSLDAKILIFDEPTTSLSNKDVKHLFSVIESLKYNGISSIYISHRMDEIFKICDRLTVLRDGEYIDTVNISDSDTESVITMMVGRKLDDLYPRTDNPIGEIVLKVSDISDRNNKVKKASFVAKKGEVVGFSGLVGSGRTELMRLLFGADSHSEGSIEVNGKDTKITSPIVAIKNGISLLTEDRKHQGLALPMSISDNINMAKIDKPLIDNKQQINNAKKYVESLDIKINDINGKVSTLSGGNQQKVVLAKWLNTDSEILIFDEPTKGIDVGAKAAIYQLIDDLTSAGKTIIMVSSEMPELLGIADRIYVMCEGKITGELSREEFDSEKIMRLSTIGGQS